MSRFICCLIQYLGQNCVVTSVLWLKMACNPLDVGTSAANMVSSACCAACKGYIVILMTFFDWLHWKFSCLTTSNAANWRKFRQNIFSFECRWVWRHFITRALFPMTVHLVQNQKVVVICACQEYFDIFLSHTEKASGGKNFTHLPQDKMAAVVADDIFKCIFLNENDRIPIKISPTFVPKGPINNIPALVQIMVWRRSGDKPLSEPMMVSLLAHICVTQPQWVNNSSAGFVYIQDTRKLGQNCACWCPNN